MAPRTPMAPFLALALVFVVGASGQASERLRITNGCAREPIWIAHMAANTIGPDAQNVEIPPLATRSFATSDGLTATRYWPKMGCDALGSHCRIGESGGPGQVCNQTIGCAPPVDTKFEASFGQNGVDWVDVSLVDGWTLPFKFEMSNNCSAGDGDREVSNVVDCSELSFDSCPTAEDVGNASSSLLDLRAAQPGSDAVVGCYSPCSKLTLNQWGNQDALGLSPFDEVVTPYCCPTPPESPGACRSGPVGDTAFVQAVHKSCPGVYGYAYDDGMGLLLCPDDTLYEMTFYCPAIATVDRGLTTTTGRTSNEGSSVSSTTTVTATAAATTAPPPAGLRSGDSIFLVAHNGHFIGVEGDRVQARLDHGGADETLIIERKDGQGAVQSGDRIFLRAHTSNLIDVQKEEVRSRWALQIPGASWQELVIEKEDGKGPIFFDDAIFLKAHTGKRIDVEDEEVLCRWNHLGAYQRLHVKAVDPVAEANAAEAAHRAPLAVVMKDARSSGDGDAPLRIGYGKRPAVATLVTVALAGLLVASAAVALMSADFRRSFLARRGRPDAATLRRRVSEGSGASGAAPVLYERLQGPLESNAAFAVEEGAVE
mmetsp:Transcript_128254/g.285793  ORF Transcript_128254/g.285793 Transcript_128254/m.285793 type:complete len:598 (+) Transcript_128254:76-1869(+)